MEYLPARSEENISPSLDPKDSIHDADVKIPGRHIPKTPYTNPTLEQNGYHTAPRVSRDHGDPSLLPYDDIPQGDGLKPPVGPYFDRSLVRNVTVQAGKAAELSCRVHETSEKSVSWIRLRDLHILTVDRYKYSTDQRISVNFNDTRKEWVLRILRATHSDAGKYECQVSTKPVLSFIVNLDVVVPTAYIINSPDIHVHRGSLINLTCVVNHGKNQPVFVYWYHRNQLVDIESNRRNVDMGTPSAGRTVSQLIVRGANVRDSGKYACKPSNGDKAQINLHVLRGELHAAMQTNAVGEIYYIYWILILTIIASLQLL